MNLSGNLLILLSSATVLGTLTFLFLAIRSHRRNRQAAMGAQPIVPQAPMDMPDGTKASRFGALLKPKDAEAIDALKSRVNQAGLYSRDAVDLYLTIRLSMLGGGFVLALLLATLPKEPGLSVLVFMTVMGLAVIGPGVWLGIRTRKRQMEILNTLPTTLDLLVTCLDAGLGLEQALERISEQSRFSDDLLASELRITLAEMRAGLDIPTAFRKFSARIGVEDVSTLTAVITQATALGTNIADILRDHAKTLRQHRLMELEERAGKANAKLTLPLTMCLLPSVMVLLLGPAVIMMMRTL